MGKVQIRVVINRMDSIAREISHKVHDLGASDEVNSLLYPRYAPSADRCVLMYLTLARRIIA